MLPNVEKAVECNEVNSFRSVGKKVNSELICREVELRFQKLRS